MAELAICDRAGISHSHFLGGPPVWSDSDQDKAVAFHDFRTAQCLGGCGTELADWDPERGGHPEAFIAGTRTCPGCRVIAEENDNLRARAEAVGVHSLAGVHVILRPRAVALAEEGLTDDENT